MMVTEEGQLTVHCFEKTCFSSSRRKWIHLKKILRWEEDILWKKKVGMKEQLTNLEMLHEDDNDVERDEFHPLHVPSCNSRMRVEIQLHVYLFLTPQAKDAWHPFRWHHMVPLKKKEQAMNRSIALKDQPLCYP